VEPTDHHISEGGGELKEPELEDERIDPRNNHLVREQRYYSEFKSRCQERGVWDRFVNQHRALKEAGHGDWDARNVLMPIWENFLGWIDAGNRWQNWDFDKFRPKDSNDAGAFEAFKVEITRKVSIHELILQDQLKQRLEYESGKVKKGPIVSDDTITLGEIANIKLRKPNSTVTRAGEVNWAYENLFAYQVAMDKSQPDVAKEIMEGAPSFGACSQLQFAYMNPANFMSNLNKNSPPKDERSEGDVTAENRYDELLCRMEQSVKVTCPNCASKF